MVSLISSVNALCKNENYDEYSCKSKYLESRMDLMLPSDNSYRLTLVLQ